MESIGAVLRKKYHDVPSEFHDDYLKVRSATMVNAARSYALWEAVRYVCGRGIAGSYVECGVWKGGQSMLAALAFSRHDRYPYLELYDTFAGMSEPTERDIRSKDAKPALEQWAARQATDHNAWAYASLEEVKANMAGTGYPTEKIRYHVGMVEHTLMESLPERISILRLDTDWYESTKIEMEMLFPRISSGGVLIVDDYGYWQGAKTAVDEYLAREGVALYLARIDRTGRVAVVP
jgi:O-methyltransferase